MLKSVHFSKKSVKIIIFLMNYSVHLQYFSGCKYFAHVEITNAHAVGVHCDEFGTKFKEALVSTWINTQLLIKVHDAIALLVIVSRSAAYIYI